MIKFINVFIMYYFIVVTGILLQAQVKCWKQKDLPVEEKETIKIFIPLPHQIFNYTYKIIKKGFRS